MPKQHRDLRYILSLFPDRLGVAGRVPLPDLPTVSALAADLGHDYLAEGERNETLAFRTTPSPERVADDG